MTATESVFVTPKRPYPPRHFATAGMPEFGVAPSSQESWFRQSVPIRPGSFVLPDPGDVHAFDPLPPRDQMKNEPVAPRHYMGRVNDIVSGAWVVTLWEVPSSRELLANISRRRIGGLSTMGKLEVGTAIDVWTWREPRQGGRWRERIHLQPLRKVRRRRARPSRS